jgi:Ca2+-binding EF-hand superfamily protein
MVARELGQDIPEEELEQMIAEFDDNKDGFIDEREFIQIMTQSSLY